jgi:hypothetical protein
LLVPRAKLREKRQEVLFLGRRVKNQPCYSLRMLHDVQPGPLSAGGPPEQVDLAHTAELRYVRHRGVDVGGGRLEARPIPIRLVGVTIAVDIDGPDVIAIRGERGLSELRMARRS